MKEAAALQFYYTSCRRGVSGYAGFQTRAESKGIHLDERRELEATALYQPPRDLPAEPDADTIAGQFPKSFKVVKLSSGRTALIRAAYTGRDYSGRWGNYFAHGLVLDGPSIGWWPIDAYAWPGWVGNLPDGEDDAEPKPLPAVPLSELTCGKEFAFEELRTFLDEKDGRPQVLAQMLNAVFRRASDSRSIIIREQHELDGVYWIACVQKAFPSACQHALTCSTFQFDPRNSLAVNATIGETDFLFDESERKYQFYVFDFVNGHPSDVPAEHSEYALTVSSWMAGEPQRLQRFHEFAALFDYHDIGSDLLLLLRLFRLESGEQVQLSAHDLQAILAFVNARALPSAFARVLDAVGYLAGSADAASPEDSALVIRFLANGATSTQMAEHRRHACKAWLNAFDRFVVQEHRGEDAVLLLRDELERKLTNCAVEIAQAFLSDTHLDWIFEHAALLPERNIGVIMTELERSCHQLGHEPTHHAQAVRSLIEAVLHRADRQTGDFQWAFTPFRADFEGLSTIVGHIVSVLEEHIRNMAAPAERWGRACSAVGRSLATVLHSASDEFRFKILNRFKADERFVGVLFAEWKAAIDRAKDKIAAHLSYERNVLADDSTRDNQTREEMAAALLKILPLQDQQRQARDWVESGRCRKLSDGVASAVLALASQHVKLEPEDQPSEHLTSLIVREITERQLDLDLHRLALRAAACRLLSEPNRADGLREVLMRADSASYAEFVSLVLPRLLASADSPGGHGKVVISMVVDRYVNTFADSYVQCLTRRTSEDLDECDVAAIVFWLRLSEWDPNWKVLGCLKKRAMEAMASQLGSMSRKKRSEVRANLKKLPALNEGRLKQALKAFLDRSDELRPSWVVRLLRWRRTNLEEGMDYGRQ